MNTKAVGEFTGEQPRSFNPNEHLMQIKNKSGASDYLPVQWRLVWFREQCPQGTIETEMVLLDLDRETEEETYAWNQEARRSEKVIKRANGIAIFRAVVKDGKGGSATGTKSEKAASFPDFIEKAETGAIGRALAELGYGTQFAPELDEQHRLADAPVEQSAEAKQAYQQRKPFVEATASVKEEELPITVEEGRSDGAIQAPTPATLRKLCQLWFKTDCLNSAMKAHYGKIITDDKLSPEQCIELRQVLEAKRPREQDKQSA